MKTPIRTLLALLLTLVAVFAVAPPANADSPVILRDARTVAQLPTCATAEKHRIAQVTDGNAASDCTTGGGSTYVVCGCNGSAWAVLPTILDHTGTMTASGTAILDVGGSTDELTVTSSTVGIAGVVTITGATTVAGATVIDGGGGADEVTVGTDTTTILGSFILPIASAPPAACAAGTKGAVYYDSDINKLCVCNATNYVLINDDTTTTGCS